MQGAYPGLTYPSTMGCDACGVVIDAKTGAETRGGKQYLVVPTRGWKDDEAGPEGDLPGASGGAVAQNRLGGKRFGLLGGTKQTGGVGCFTEYMTVEEDQLVESPPHLDATEAAALPCGGVTAYRALFTKGRLRKGQNVLITGIGGGVALVALRLALAAGANVFVTGGSQAKIDRAVSLGATAGAIYKDAKAWPEAIRKSLPSDRPFVDVVIDSAGGPIPAQAIKAGLKPGGKLVCFGMTAQPRIDFTMREVLKNVDLLGSTMGSEKEFRDCVAFVAANKVRLDVDCVLQGLEQARDQGFDLLREEGKRSGGKVVVSLASSAGDTRAAAKL